MLLAYTLEKRRIAGMELSLYWFRDKSFIRTSFHACNGVWR